MSDDEVIDDEFEDILTLAINGARSCFHVPEEDLKRLENEKVKILTAWLDEGWGPEHDCMVLVQLKEGFAVITEGEDTSGHGCQCNADVGFYKTLEDAITLGLNESNRLDFIAKNKIILKREK